MSEHSQETKIAILEEKVEHMMGHVKELTLRVRANEKVVASVSLLGVIACTFIGAGYFAPKADAAPSVGEWTQRMRDWKSEQERTPVDDSINNALENLWEETEDGRYDPTESEELLQFPSDEDQQGDRWRHDRRDTGPRVQPDKERESPNCRCGHSREKDEEFRRERARD